MRCLSCEYDLSNLTEHRCPECGQEFHPEDSTTFESDDPPYVPPIWLLIMLTIAWLLFTALWRPMVFSIIFLAVLLVLICYRFTRHDQVRTSN